MAISSEATVIHASAVDRRRRARSVPGSRMWGRFVLLAPKVVLADCVVTLKSARRR